MKNVMLKESFLIISCLLITVQNGIASDQALELLQMHKESFAQLPFQPLAYGIIENRYPYQILDIETQGDAICVLVKTSAPYTYLIGNPNEQQLEEIVTKLSDYCQQQDQIFDPMHDEKIALICDESLHGYFIHKGFVIKPRMQFKCIERKKICKNPLPDEYQVVPINNYDLFRQSTWCDFIAASCGGIDKFFEQGFGYAVVNENGVSIAEAYGAWSGNNECEIGIVTHPDYRGKGLVIHALENVLDECERRDIKPVWSCNCDNIPSMKIALKMGFQIQRYYVFLKKF